MTRATADVSKEQAVDTLPEVSDASTEELVLDSRVLQPHSPSKQLQLLRRSQREGERKPSYRLDNV